MRVQRQSSARECTSSLMSACSCRSRRGARRLRGENQGRHAARRGRDHARRDAHARRRRRCTAILRPEARLAAPRTASRLRACLRVGRHVRCRLACIHPARHRMGCRLACTHLTRLACTRRAACRPRACPLPAWRHLVGCARQWGRLLLAWRLPAGCGRPAWRTHRAHTHRACAHTHRACRRQGNRRKGRRRRACHR